jgi:hypothetical protein
MKRVCPILLFLLLTLACWSQDTLKSIGAVRTAVAPKIDGVLDDEAWINAPPSADFRQCEPYYNVGATQRTEVKIVYDDNAIYIGAFMYDTHPDSILHELGARDEDDLNSDLFIIVFDTYSKLIDAYVFGVTPSGVQRDSRIQDETFDAVWYSATRITDKGWCCEFKIPYSAIRFPDTKEQEWRMEFHRLIRRNRELDRYPIFPKDDPNIIKYFAKLKGLSDIKAPIRLSMTPYVSGYIVNEPEYDANGSSSHVNSYSYNAGADIKYGIDERFTLDMILLPDFGQVQSDSKVKNLSYREVTYDENRSFFKEGTELFNKNNLFYSRRIGRTPGLFYDVPYLLNPGETILSNPSQTKLLNATKVSGRTNSGLGIGIFNAVTNEVNAEIEDSLGHKRKIMTEPLTNYNILVFDQQLKNSSSFYVINTNVVRDKNQGAANVTGTGFSLLNKKNTIQFSGDNALSQKLTRIDSLDETYNNQLGYKYFFALEKVGGNFTYGVKHEALNNTFDQRDLGYFKLNNFRNYVVYFNYNQFNPGKLFLFSGISNTMSYSENFTTGKRSGNDYSTDLYCMLKRYIALFCGGGLSPYKNYDYYEPRVPGKFYINRRYYFTYAGLSTDYRKKVALDLKGNIAQYINEGIDGMFYEINPGLRFRLSDRLSIFYDGTYSFDKYNEGFANFDSAGQVIIGGRELTTWINSLKVKFIFSEKMALTLNARHYWNTGHYVKYFQLQDDGGLLPDSSYHANNDFNYNAFNIDLVYSWIFSPGSQLSIVYKNAIETDESLVIRPRFNDNFDNTLAAPQTNSISIKFLYYLDYLSLKKKKK